MSRPPRVLRRAAVFVSMVAMLAVVVGCDAQSGQSAAYDDPVTTLPVPANMPPFPLPSDIPPVPLPSAVPNVQMPSAIPRVEIPSEVPHVELPAEIPQVPLPAPPPPLADQAKMLDAQAKAKKVDADIASKQSDDALKLEELRSDQNIHAMDERKEMVIHAADAQKAQLDAEKVKADVAGKQSQTAQAEVDSRRKTGVELIKAGLGAHKDAQEHQLNMQNHAMQSQQNQHDQAISTHQALNPPKPAPNKPSGKK